MVAIQFVGFPNVISTMWGIMDTDAAVLSYQHMFVDEELLDSVKAARVLNSAVTAEWRDETVTLDTWTCT